MWCLRGADAVRRRLAGVGSVVTIGAYDGVHLGHQALLQRTRDAARRLAAPAVVVSFEPTPKEYFAGAAAPARLTRFRERAELFRGLDMDGFFCLRFDSKLAGIKVDAFIDRLLIDALATRHLVIGDDFRFGHRAAGGVTDLVAAGRQHGFAVEQVDSVVLDGRRVSSTLVRNALAHGDLATANAALGRRYRLTGRVRYGQQLGRTLGYPTANIALHRRVPPVSGIFAVRVDGAGLLAAPGVASIGTRPTVDGEGVLLEVHLFDYDGDLYGARLSVELVAKIRDEERFDSLDALTAQMHDDAAVARAILAAS